MIFAKWRLPAWSAFDDRKTHDQFVEAVHTRLHELEVSFTERGDGRVLALDGGAALDLEVVSAAAAAVPPEGWAEAIRGFVASATNPNRAPTTPEQLRPAVRTRLLAVEELERFPKELPSRRHADLAEVLVINSRRSVVWAGEQDLLPLELGLDELFVLGRDNVRAHEPVTLTTLDVAGGTITLAEGPGDGVASWALLVDDLLDVPAAGVVIAVPTRRTLLALPLGGPDADGAIAGMAATAAERAEQGPASLSPRLHLWRGGELTAHT